MTHDRDDGYKDELGQMAKRAHFTVAFAEVQQGATPKTTGGRLSRIKRRTLGAQRVADERRLQRIIFATGLVLAIVALTVTGIFAQLRVSNSLRGAVAEELRTIRDIEVSAVRYWVESRLEVATTLAEDPDVAQAAVALFNLAATTRIDVPSLRSPKARVWTETVHAKARNAGFFATGLIDPTFHMIAAHDEKFVGSALNLSSQVHSYLLRALRGTGPTFAPPRLYGGSVEPRVILDSRYAVFFGVPIKDTSGRVIGVVAFGELVEDNLQKIVRVGSVADSGESYAIDVQGTITTTSRFEKQVRSAWSSLGLTLADPRSGIPVRDPGGNLLDGHKPVDDLDALPFTRIAAQCLAAQKIDAVDKHQGVITEPYRDYRGVKVVGAWRWLPEYGISVITEIDAVEAFAALRFLNITTASVVAALLLMASGWGGVSLALRRAKLKFKNERLGSYRMIRKINEGGVGEVYLAQHDQLRRPAAVKVLKETRPTPAELKRFEDEALQACRLSHPNTVQIYDFGVAEDGRLYFAMEYLRGINLGELLAIEGAVAPARAVHIVKQVLSSLKEAHSLGLIHRDVKPHNVMLCRVGGSYDFVKVLDFGLVKSLRREGVATEGQTRHLVGTPLYMAPERLRKGGVVDHRSDLYSVGLLLYVLIAGHGPFVNDDDFSLIGEILANRPRTLRSPAGPLPQALESFVMRCLAGNPDHRPQSAESCLSELATLKLVWAPSAARAWWDARPSLQASVDLGRISASRNSP